MTGILLALIATAGGIGFSPSFAHQASVAVATDETRILATGKIDLGAPILLSLAGNAERLWLRFHGESSTASHDLPVSVPIAVVILSNRRLSFLWDGLIGWAGEDLVRLRDSHIAMTRAALVGAQPIAAQNSAQSLVRPRITALMQHTAALTDGGRGMEAIAMLRAALPSRLRADQDKQDFSILHADIARIMRILGDKAGADASLREATQRMGRSDFRLNLMINRASHLAADGRHAEALEEIDAALAQFESGPADLRVPGSERQFNWVRACALHGLGRTEEARLLIAAVAAAAQPMQPMVILEANENISTRLALCLGNVDGAVAELTRALQRSPFSNVVVLLQPGIERPNVSAELLLAIRSHPGMQRLAAEQVRTLPPSLLPAMRRWRDASRD